MQLGEYEAGYEAALADRIRASGAHDLLIRQAEQTERGASFRALDMQLLQLCPCPV